MNHRTKSLLTGFALALAAMPVVAQGNGSGGNANTKLITYLASLPVEQLSPAEQLDLTHMVQEEKLARDVYRVLAQTSNLPVYANIAQAEQEHMDLVRLMMTRYRVPDPLPSDRVGVYADPLFTQLFAMLTDFGRQSTLHAAIAGAVIEELDIVDLDGALLRSDNRDLDTVWQNLQRGSRNHLRSFAGLIEARGIVYPGIFMSYARVVAILTSPRETAPVDENGVRLP